MPVIKCTNKFFAHCYNSLQAQYGKYIKLPKKVDKVFGYDIEIDDNYCQERQCECIVVENDNKVIN